MRQAKMKGYSEITASDVNCVLDFFFQKYDVQGSPGLAIAVLRGTDLLAKRAFGAANVEHNIPWRTDTPARVASLSKHMAAALALLMNEKGSLDITASIRRYLPELPAIAEPITVAHLITNRSGLFVDEALAWLAGRTTHCPGDLDYLFRLVSAQGGTLHGPGEAYLYNDTGFRLVVRIIERASGKPVGHLLNAYLFEPLAMVRSGFWENDELSIEGVAQCYHSTDNIELRRYFGFMESSGDGACISTLDEMTIWLRALLDPPAEFDRMAAALRTCPGRADTAPNIYGYGLDFGTHRGVPWRGHTGATFGYCGMHIFGCNEFSILFLGNYNQIDIRGLPFLLFDKILEASATDGKSTPYLVRREHLISPTDDDAITTAPCLYFNEATGLVADIARSDDVLRVGLLGGGAYLRETNDGLWRAEEGLMSCALRLRSTSCEIHLGDRWRTYLPVKEDRYWETMQACCVGLYYAPTIGATLEIATGDDGPVALIAGAPSEHQRLELRPVSDHVLWNARISIKLDQERDGRFHELSVSNFGARHITYRRFPDDLNWTGEICASLS